MATRRAQLDVFWTREPSNVASKSSRLRRDYLDSTTIFSLGKDVLPYLPSKKIVDRVGLIPAIMTLGASLRQGVIIGMYRWKLPVRLQPGTATHMMSGQHMWEPP